MRFASSGRTSLPPFPNSHPGVAHSPKNYWLNAVRLRGGIDPKPRRGGLFIELTTMIATTKRQWSGQRLWRGRLGPHCLHRRLPFLGKIVAADAVIECRA